MVKKFLLIFVVLPVLWLLLGGQAFADPLDHVSTCPDKSVSSTCDTPSATTDQACKPKSSEFLGLTTWYAYLPGKTNPEGGCDPQLKCTASDAKTQTCDQQSKVDISKIWLIGLALLQLLLRLSGMVAVGIVIFGGIKYITSQGQPDATKGARTTILNAFIGIAIVITAAVIVNFIARVISNGALK